MLKILFIGLLIVSMGTSADDIIVDGIRESLKNASALCSGRKPLAEQTVSPRIPDGNLTPLEAEKVIIFARKQPEIIKKCIRDFEDTYRKKIFDHCAKNSLGNCTGGGCSYISAMIHAGVTAQAIGKCVAVFERLRRIRVES